MNALTFVHDSSSEELRDVWKKKQCCEQVVYNVTEKTQFDTSCMNRAKEGYSTLLWEFRIDQHFFHRIFFTNMFLHVSIYGKWNRN